MNQEQELSKMSGENTIKTPEKYIVPSIKLDGQVGSFSITTIEKDDKGSQVVNKQPLPNEFQGVMLKVRRNLFHYTTSEKLFTNEHNSYKDKVIVFSATKKKDDTWGKPSIVFDGNYKEARAAFPELRMKQAIYFLMPEYGIVKLFVKGKGLSHLFDYWKEFGSSEHIFQFQTKVGLVEEKSQLGKYFAMTFEKGERLKDITEVADKIKEVCDNLDKVDEYYASNAPVAPEEVGKERIDMPKMEDIPVIEEDRDEDEDPIDVKDIPF